MRKDLDTPERDADNGLEKFNPLLDRTNDDVWAYIRRFAAPHNTLHHKFFPQHKVGPCTRGRGR